MINNVILDVAIGIVFIFLLYSLLATSIQEAIATILALRARTLKDGIVNGMLCNTPDISKWQSIIRGIGGFFKEIWYLIPFVKRPAVEQPKLGHLFYDHPLIKNYGANQVFPTPSYIPTPNFSAVLVDILKDDFNNKLDAIAAYQVKKQGNNTATDQVKQALQSLNDFDKIKTLLQYYIGEFEQIPVVHRFIETDTLKVLMMHLNNSKNDLELFEQKLETWFDDSMNRVSGWYKRRTQVILFVIGIFLAVTFNVDVIDIAGKLSTDKDARDQLVQLSVKQADAYKDDPRVKRLTAGTDSIAKDTAALKAIQAGYQKHLDEAKHTIDSGVVRANQILALGWGDYGMKKDSAKALAEFKRSKENRKAVVNNLDTLVLQLSHTTNPAEQACLADTMKKYADANTGWLTRRVVDTFYVVHGRYTQALLASKKDSSLKAPVNPTAAFISKYNAAKNQAILHHIYNQWGGIRKLKYVIVQCFDAKKFLGFLLTAFAVCLGAPFWFDTLNKLIKLRAAGKKEDASDDNSNSDKSSTATTKPVQITVVSHPAAAGL
ncbi:hypothetical protein C8P68_102277 [Mucilaginibacter yixingensis]|uniref:Uncharacterized protein n=1 Tax=Mucilaginibacter yixingensis TaxID=1295612 RepID=A0A2T5JCG4_9SPHI|nr:hypothetical protein [Mucilaginibacter yixingensis]PTQ99453.1 hypothetical protein C8P68_102277 [Mucilaginibacter yixingensis]